MSNDALPRSSRPVGVAPTETPRPANEPSAKTSDSGSLACASDTSGETAASKISIGGTEDMSFFERLKIDVSGRVLSIPRLLDLHAQRGATIDQLVKLDQDRVRTIQELTERLARITAGEAIPPGLDAQRVATIQQLMALDADRVTTINTLVERLTSMDGLTMAGRNLAFLDEPVFRAAWEKSKVANADGWPDGVPDVRMRAHLALWAARQGLRLKGDFVECGVHTGLLSLVICHALEFARLPRSFYLFDTFNGIPVTDLASSDQARGKQANAAYYRDVWDVAQRNFSPFPNARLIRGELPGTLREASIEKIAYLSVDLNNAVAEKAVILELWPKLVPGAVVLIDDYAWQGLEAQHDMWNAFSAEVGVPIAALPTGQGLMIKPAP